MMRRSVPAALAVLLVAAATAGCGGQTSKAVAEGSATPALPATSSPAAPVKAPPLSEEEARGIVKDLTAKVEADNFDAEYWKGITEGPLLEQQLAVVETSRKYGTERPSVPSDSPPKNDSAVHIWSTGKDDGSDRWILGAHEVEGHTVGEAKGETVLRWSLFHQQRTGAPWLAAFLARAPETTALPGVAVGPDGRAVTGADAAGLAADPAKVCGQYGDYLHTDTGAGGVKWSQDVADVKAASAAGLKAMRKDLGKGAKLDVAVDVNRAPHGPVWRTTDGGALVACTAVSKVYTELGPGRATTFSSSGWAGTTGIPWASYTQRIMGLTVLKVPAGASGEVSVAAESNLPYSFEGTKSTG